MSQIPATGSSFTALARISRPFFMDRVSRPFFMPVVTATGVGVEAGVGVATGVGAGVGVVVPPREVPAPEDEVGGCRTESSSTTLGVLLLFPATERT